MKAQINNIHTSKLHIMTNSIKFGALLMCILLIPAMQSFTVAKPETKSCEEKVESMTLMQVAEGRHVLSWSPVMGMDPYSVTVTDLTTNTLHAQFSTYNTSAIISDLIGGHLYNFRVSKQDAMQDLNEQ